MEINRKAIKANAKLQMREAKPSPIVVFLVMGVAILAVYLAVYLLSLMFAGLRLGWIASFFITIVPIAIGLAMFPLSFGWIGYTVKVSRLQPAGFSDLLGGFSMAFKAIKLGILVSVFIYLWSLLLVIPGIIAAYRYRMSFYLLFDHPELGALDCINESKKMMNGRKSELFLLDLSFIGWMMLCAVPLVALYVTPYVSVTWANYYNALLGLEEAEREQQRRYQQQYQQQYGQQYQRPNDSYNNGKPPWES